MEEAGDGGRWKLAGGLGQSAAQCVSSTGSRERLWAHTEKGEASLWSENWRRAAGQGLGQASLAMTKKPPGALSARTIRVLACA